VIELAKDALAGYGLMSLAATVVLVSVLCVDWRAWRKRRRMHMASHCRYCNYTGRRDLVKAHESEDHPR
jgi:hypothetical protein